MRYTEARYKKNDTDTVYRIYLTDALKVLANLEVRYADVLKWNDEPKETEAEIIGRIRGKLA